MAKTERKRRSWIEKRKFLKSLFLTRTYFTVMANTIQNLRALRMKSDFMLFFPGRSTFGHDTRYVG